MQNIFERFVDQHDQALEQLSYFEVWLGLLPHERAEDRHTTMRRVPLRRAAITASIASR